MVEKRGTKTDEIEGLPVHLWRTQREIADDLGITGRHVQNLERKGLPATGHRATKRYPIPHAVIWYARYSAREENTDRAIGSLPFPVALAEHRLEEARALAGSR